MRVSISKPQACRSVPRAACPDFLLRTAVKDLLFKSPENLKLENTCISNRLSGPRQGPVSIAGQAGHYAACLPDFCSACSAALPVSSAM